MMIVRWLFFVANFACISKICTAQVLLTSSNLPIVAINTNGFAIPDANKITASMSVFYNALGKRNNLTDEPNFKGLIGIELRGSTSQELSPKKPYSIETRNEKGENLDVALMGLPADNDWVLLAPYSDKTLIRDPLAYFSASQISKVYVPRYRFCELILNNEYQGVYILVEKIKKAKNRVNIATLKNTDNTGDDVTGGYILKFDKVTGSKAYNWYSTVNTPSSVLLQVEYPKIDAITADQGAYIKRYISDFEQKMMFSNPQDKSYLQTIDIESFVDYFIVTELANNIDGYRLSTYFYKDKDSKNGKIIMGPIWDYNIAFGNVNYYDGFLTSGWRYSYPLVAEKYFIMPAWWSFIVNEPSFKKRVKEKWLEMRQSVLKTDKMERYIDSTAAVLNEAQTRNFQQWKILDKIVWPNYSIGYDYQQEIAILKSWLRMRAAWIDAQMTTFETVVTATDDYGLKPNSVTIFPNPTASVISLQYFTDVSGKISITVFDERGSIVAEKTENKLAGNNQTIIKMPESIANGQYYVWIQTPNNGYSQKCMIQK